MMLVCEMKLYAQAGKIESLRYLFIAYLTTLEKEHKGDSKGEFFLASPIHFYRTRRQHMAFDSQIAHMTPFSTLHNDFRPQTEPSPIKKYNLSHSPKINRGDRPLKKTSQII